MSFGCKLPVKWHKWEIPFSKALAPTRKAFAFPSGSRELTGSNSRNQAITRFDPGTGEAPGQ